LPITVLTVDDDATARSETRELIAATPGLVSVGEVGSGEEALEAVLELEPDLAIVDIEMPGLDGYETSRRVLAARPCTTVLLVSTAEAPAPREAVESSGAGAAIARTALTPQALVGLSGTLSLR
jgi:DNA-binding NarL/FixJ family response regulator